MADSALRPRWSEAELALLRVHFTAGGLDACRVPLDGRSDDAIRMKAQSLDLRDPIRGRTGSRAAFRRTQLGARVYELRQLGWTHARIADELGINESTVANFARITRCREEGFVPARRARPGELLRTEIDRMRAMMLAGMRGVDIQLRMAVAGATVSVQRRKFAAELALEGRSLPPPGGQLVNSGRKVSRAHLAKINRLIREGLPSKIVAERAQASLTRVIRMRAAIVRRLAAKGNCLPGNDLNGRVLRSGGPARLVPDALATAFRALLLDGMPRRWAANEVGIGGASAKRLRLELVAELAADGRTLPPLRMPKSRRRSRWVPVGGGWVHRLAALAAEHGVDEARTRIQIELAARRTAEVARPSTFDEQLARVAAGARLVAVLPRGRAQAAEPLGPIGEAMC